MNHSRSRLLAATFLLALGAPTVRAKDAIVTAVYSSVSNGYTRQKLPDGTFQREYYALANGLYAPGQNKDDSIDTVPFSTVASLVANLLGQHNYFLAQDSKSADLLLVIAWGTTIPFDGGGGAQASLDNTLSAMNTANAANRNAAANANTQQGMQNVKAETAAVAAAANDDLENQLVEMNMFNDMRNQANERNARLLGYSGEINRRNNPSRFAGAGTAFEDLKADLEEERYYVIVSAYDFREAKEHGKRKLLWATRVSIRAQDNRFDERLAVMLAKAAHYFGEDSRDLIREYQGTVKMDDLKFIGATPNATPPPEAAKDKK